MKTDMLPTFLVLLNLIQCQSVQIFHEGSKVAFHPNVPAEYFGYVVVLTDSGLYVGAPKAMSKFKNMRTGAVFSCPFKDLQTKNVTCENLGLDNPQDSRHYVGRMYESNFFKDEMWLGASIASVPVGKLIICAPRWSLLYRERYLLANGVCYLMTKKKGLVLMPFKEMNRQAYITDGLRQEYGEYGTHLNLYAFGQAGMSVRVAGYGHIIIGAPGLLQWAGGIVDYNFIEDEDSLFCSKQPTSNPYFTKNIAPDDYFGYSVDAGYFENQTKVLYAAGAPRAKLGYGQVLVFEPAVREFDSITIKAWLQGPQVGAYFGASLCILDIDGDKRSDMLVGAPNYVRKEDGAAYDQGAVFVYFTRATATGFELKEAGFVIGSGSSGARFGSAIADLDDLDGDGYTDVAIGAPWEDNERGVVYIYRGSARGLLSRHVQRLTVEGATGFGMSISTGFDVDGNHCKDLAVGAFLTGAAYLYRSVPTISIEALIKVPNAMDLSQNATNFTVLFCVNVLRSRKDLRVNLDLKAKISVDRKSTRAVLSGDDEYKVAVTKTGVEMCEEQTVEVKALADLSQPILLTFELHQMEPIQENSTDFDISAVRISEDSKTHTSFEIQLTRDCGEDLVCRPSLHLELEALDGSPYIPGSSQKLGVKITVTNLEEPAFGAKVHILLPASPLRVPGSCTLQDWNMTCDVPAPLLRGAQVVWSIQLEYMVNTTEESFFKVEARIEDPFYIGNVSDVGTEELIIKVVPKAKFELNGKALPNTTLSVPRKKLDEKQNITIVHYFEVLNWGPSDWSSLRFIIYLSRNVTLQEPVAGCSEDETRFILCCSRAVPAKYSFPIVLSMRYSLRDQGDFLEQQMIANITTLVSLEGFNRSTEVYSTLILDPAPPVWPLIVGVISGLVLLAGIVYGLYKYGFFSRSSKEKLKLLQTETSPETEPGPSSQLPEKEDETTQGLLEEDSDL